MTNASRFQATLALTYYALFPQTADRCISPPAGSENQSRNITAAEIAKTLANLDRYTDSNGSLELLFNDAFSIAAPFLLFRLKRTGFSACRVQRVPEGLLLSARR